MLIGKIVLNCSLLSIKYFKMFKDMEQFKCCFVERFLYMTYFSSSDILCVIP